MAFKRVRTISEWETHFEGSSFNFLHSQGLCIVSTNRKGTVVNDGTLSRVMNRKTREAKWMLMRPNRPSRFLA